MPVPGELQTVDGVEPMQVDDDDSVSHASSEYNVDNPNFDLEGYSSSFSGLARVRRLLFVAQHCSSLKVEALKLALRTVEGTHNTALFSTICQKLHQATGKHSYAMDSEEVVSFVSSTNRKAAILLERLDSDQKNYRSNSIKESIRRGFNALGDHYLDCGELNQALKMYMRARDHCTSSGHIVQLCLNVIKVNVLLGNWQQVLNYYNKADNSLDTSETSKLSSASQHETATRLACAAGLAEMENKKYKNAARLLSKASIEHCKCPDLLSPYTVAVYGSLCALASYSRQDLYNNILTSSSFKQFLELEPQMRDVLYQFYQAKYTGCLRTLEQLRENLLLDMYLAPHLTTLYTMIRNKALIQYFSPYLSVDLHRMAAAFNTSIGQLEDELTHLILDGQISARIDSHAKIMYARNVDQRSAVFQKALEFGETYQLRTKALLVRAMLQKHSVLITQADSVKPMDSDISTDSKRTKPRH